ncbi:NADP transhydrogenase subunit alpha [Solitalea longa]|uniref:NADP transhydrogenase subunit alpha n=1 Tax=Solitalea longa TaxID=2079460 RepID=A0A2S5A3G7_9SPHI|nr:NAD(P)-binding protein [Solitalea longa]POY37130.1 NADP transhydrogenase subunit alpha [Solitalea longa]
MKKKVAIIGSGLAGLGAAYHLKEHFDITIFEEKDQSFGQTKTFSINKHQDQLTVDVTFNAINETVDSNIIQLFNKLQIPLKPASVSFGIQQQRFGLEYGEENINAFFAQPKRVFDGKQLQLYFHIKRFHNNCLSDINEVNYSNHTLKQYAREKGLSAGLLNNYLIPISAIIWAVPFHKAADFPAILTIQYLRKLIGSDQNSRNNWLTPENWTLLTQKLDFPNLKKNKKVRFVKRQLEYGRMIVVLFFEDGSVEKFDKIIFACHANQALRILEDDATNLEYSLLRNFKYEKNKVLVHSDESVMPINKRAWAAFNYRMEEAGRVSLVKWVNRFEKAGLSGNYFVSINDSGKIDNKKVLGALEMELPLFDLKTLKTQEQLSKLNQLPEFEDRDKTTFFCGSYFKNGLYEETYKSAISCSEAVLHSQKNKMPEMKVL